MIPPNRRRSAGLLAVALLAGLLVAVPSGPAAAAPIFKLPFRCGEIWHAGTYPGHSPDVDFNAYPSDGGRAVLASASGTVRVGLARIGEMIIEHGDGWSTRYLHLENRRTGLDGAFVSVGTQIGTVGAVGGGATSPHLHYEQRRNGVEQPVAIDGTRIAVGRTDAGAPSYRSTNCGADPVGWLDSVSGSGEGTIRLRGWVFDGDDASTPVALRVYVGGPHGTPGVEVKSGGVADRSRPDVARVRAEAGPNTGFDTTIGTGKRGRVPVCVYALNIDAGANVMLGCNTITISGDIGVTVGYSQADYDLLARAARFKGASVEQFVRDSTIILAFLVYISDPSEAHAIRPAPSTTGPQPVALRWSDQEISGVDGIGRFFSLGRAESQRVSANLFAYLALLEGA